jgi:hypothetical protein
LVLAQLYGPRLFDFFLQSGLAWSSGARSLYIELAVAYLATVAVTLLGRRPGDAGRPR